MGTQASQSQRLAVIDRLLEHPEPRFNGTGVTALRVMLNAGQFTAHHDLDFGARPRGDGWRPVTNEEQAGWSRTALTPQGNRI